MQPSQRSTNRQTRKPVLRDGRINHPLITETIQQPLRDLVGAIVLRDFLAQDEHLRVGLQLLRFATMLALEPIPQQREVTEGLVESFAHCVLLHA